MVDLQLRTRPFATLQHYWITPSMRKGAGAAAPHDYEGARAEFNNATEADADCAMGYWGQAMTFIHPLWSDPPKQQEFAQGRALLERARSGGTRIAREDAYIAAAAGYYDEGWNLNESENLASFARQREMVHRRFPDVVEAAAFHALTHLATNPTVSMHDGRLHAGFRKIEVLDLAFLHQVLTVPATSSRDIDAALMEQIDPLSVESLQRYDCCVVPHSEPVAVTADVAFEGDARDKSSMRGAPHGRREVPAVGPTKLDHFCIGEDHFCIGEREPAIGLNVLTPEAAATPHSERVLERMRQDRAIVILGLATIAALAWASLVRMSGGMNAEMAMPLMRVWSVVDLVLLFLMWAVMMVAMMLPTAGPMVLTFVSVQRRRREGRQPYVNTGVFVAGYLVVWSVYAVAATLAQWGLHHAALLSPMMVSTSPALGAALLFAAGMFQFTRLKHVCLTKCRSPLGFIAAEWREGGTGAWQMGMRHGMHCVGCCWILMALLFVAGVMNLAWVAVIAGFVLLEKITPGGKWVSRIAGVLLAAAGLWMGAAVLG